MTDTLLNPGQLRPGRLSVGVIGPGRVGAVLGAALQGVGHRVVATSPSSDSERVAALLPQVPVVAVEQVVERAELILLTVPDDALASVVQGIASLNLWQPGHIVVHTAGRYGTRVLDPARRQGAIGLAIHPAMTFTGTSLDIGRLTHAVCAVTADGAFLPIAQALVLELGGEPVVVADADRALYHAGMAHAANHASVLIAQAAQVLRAAGVSEPGRALTALVQAAVEDALRAGESAVSTMTGPVVRGDVGTVESHLTALEELATQEPDALDIGDTYRSLARATAVRALGAGRINATAAGQLLDILSTEVPLQDPPADR